MNTTGPKKWKPVAPEPKLWLQLIVGVVSLGSGAFAAWVVYIGSKTAEWSQLFAGGEHYRLACAAIALLAVSVAVGNVMLKFRVALAY